MGPPLPFLPPPFPPNARGEAGRVYKNEMGEEKNDSKTSCDAAARAVGAAVP